MKNTKENRIKYLKNQFESLKKGVDIDKLKIATENLNNVLAKKRQIIIVKRFNELRNELRNELGNELRNELRNELGNWNNYWEYYENNWVLFVNEFYPQLKIIQKNKKKIEAIKQLMETGNCYLLISKTKLYVISFPEIRVNEQKKLHNTKDYALKWLDKKTYWLEGVKFNKSLWEKIVNNKLSGKEILNIKNIEQRMIAMKMRGIENLLTDLNAKLLNKSERGNELYLIEKAFSQPAYFLKYQDKSTDRVYCSGIDPEFAKENPKADDCMSWKFNITLNQYQTLKIES